MMLNFGNKKRLVVIDKPFIYIVLKIQIGGFAHDVRRKLFHHQVLFKMFFILFFVCCKVIKNVFQKNKF